jgi:hypothetical protein
VNIIQWVRELRAQRRSADDDDMEATFERIVQLSNPRLRYARGYKARLRPAVRTAIGHARYLLESVPAACEASTNAWQTNPCIRSFFAAAQDLAKAFTRSAEVRTWFAQNPAAHEIFAVLSMQLVERRVLGIALEAGVLRRDVPQTTVSFGDYRTRMCAATEVALRSDVERRIVDQLALTAIANVANDGSRRDALEQECALLRTRLRLLDAKGAGLSGLALRVDPGRGELSRLQMELAQNEANLRSIAAGFEGLERQLDELVRVLGAPTEHFSLAHRRVRVDNMNIVLPDDSTLPGAALDLQIARIPIPGGPPEFRTFIFVRFPRAELLQKSELLSEAAQMLH